MRSFLATSFTLCGIGWLFLERLSRHQFNHSLPPSVPVIINDSKIAKMKLKYESYKAIKDDKVKYADCPPSRISVEGREISFDVRKPEFYGSASVGLVSSDRTLLMKFVTSSDESFKNALSREKAVLETIGESLKGIVPRVFPVEDERIKLHNPGCSHLIMLTSFAGDRTLCDAERMKLSKSEVARIAARVITMVKQIHSFGIIHGDISCKNFVFKGDQIDEIIESLRVIDFGLAAPYSENQTHVQESVVINLPSNREKWQLSPFELRGMSPSRRDDMYRVSEILYLILGGTYPFMGWNSDPSSESLAKRKTKWRAPLFSPRVFTEFHHDMVNLDFQQQPDYDKWIKLFSDI